jgi:nucleoside-diphosphate-sugar epimerase
MPWHSAFRTVNVDGSRHVAEACVATDSKPTLIHLSSLAAAGPARDASPLNETQPPAPVSRYGKVKLASEQAVASVASHLPVTIVRPPMVYGAGDPSTQKLFRGIDRGWHILPTRKDTLLSTIHVEDLVEGLVQLADSGERLPDEQTLGGKGLYYLSSHDPITFADLGLAIATALERPAPRIIRLPLMATRSVAALVELGARLRSRPSLINLDKIKEAAAGHWLCSSDKATRHVGFSTRPLVERLKQTAHWYLETRTSA